MSKWISMALIGLASGLVARFFLPGNDSMGLIRTTIFGVGGSFVGPFLAQQLGQSGQGWLWSILGAMALLFVNRFL